MSTKCTVRYSDDFHFYRECMDDDNLYLQINKAKFESYNDFVTLTIPKAIWAIIRESEPVELEYATLTDEQILEKVTQEVDKRIEDHKAQTDEGLQMLYNFAGSLLYGMADDVRNTQIMRGISWHNAERKREKAILKLIKRYEKMNNKGQNR